MKLLLLGPVELVSGGRPIPIGRRRERLVLAALALQAGRAVPVERLAAVAWAGAEPPDNARAAIKVSASRLRKVLAPYGVSIASRGDAYVLDPGQIIVDAWQFRRAVTVALAQATREGQASGLRGALRLWRGDVMEDVATPHVRRSLAGDLVELRLVAQQRWLEAEIDLGRAHEAVAELRRLVAEHPTHESLVGLLMTALVRSGRPAEALDVYGDLRRRLTDELGADPGPDLARLHLRILRQAGEHDELTTGDVVATLPRDVPALIGRADALADLDRAVTGAAPLVVVTGPGGIGKTALAVRWAHRASPRFPDGQLYINLHGYGPGRAPTTNEALTQLLLALGQPLASIPPGTDGAATALRARLSGRRILIVIDNAASAEQVRPLLPGASGCGVIVTSRDALTGLTAIEGAARVPLRPLSGEHSLAVLRHVVGDGRVAGEIAAATDLAGLCGGLPLALRVAAANLAGRPDTSIAAYRGRMTGAGVLDALQVDGDLTTGVRATLASSYESLSEPARHLYRLLGVPAGTEFTVEAGAALIGAGVAGVRRLVDELCRAHLAEAVSAQRYAMHDLVRAYAVELCAGGPDTGAARARMLAFYEHSARNAAVAAYPNRRYLGNPPQSGSVGACLFADRDEALAWLDAEVTNLAAESERAAESGPYAFAWETCDSLAGYFWLRRHAALWARTIEAAERAARAAGDERMAVQVLNRRGIMHWAHSEYETAERAFLAVSEMARQIGDVQREVAALGNIGGINRELGRFARARSYSRRAFDLHLALGNRHGAAGSLIALAAVSGDMADSEESLAYARQAVGIYRDIDDAEGLGSALIVLIDALTRLNRPHSEIEPAIREAQQIYESVGSSVGQAALSNSAADAALADGRPTDALALAERALALVGPANNPALRGSSLFLRGRASQALGDHAAALADFEIVESEFQRLGVRAGVVEALIAQAEVALADGARDDAARLAATALERAERPTDVAAAERLVAATSDAEMARGGVPGAAMPGSAPYSSRS